MKDVLDTEVGNGMAKVYFENKDGLKLVGIIENHETITKTCIMLCHGATVDKEEGGIFTELSSRLVKAGFSTFRFDFRGFEVSVLEEGNISDNLMFRNLSG